jgi:hypothetical protein
LRRYTDNSRVQSGWSIPLKINKLPNLIIIRLPFSNNIFTHPSYRTEHHVYLLRRHRLQPFPSCRLQGRTPVHRIRDLTSRPKIINTGPAKPHPPEELFHRETDARARMGMEGVQSGQEARRMYRRRADHAKRHIWHVMYRDRVSGAQTWARRINAKMFLYVHLLQHAVAKLTISTRREVGQKSTRHPSVPPTSVHGHHTTI